MHCSSYDNIPSNVEAAFIRSTKTQRFLKTNVVIHCITLAEYSKMNTHVPGFQSFFKFYASFCIVQISHQQHKGYQVLFYCTICYLFWHGIPTVCYITLHFFLCTSIGSSYYALIQNLCPTSSLCLIILYFLFATRACNIGM